MTRWIEDTVLIVAGDELPPGEMLELGSPKSGWFRVLKVSMRKSRLSRSVNLNVLEIPVSKENQLGPRKELYPALPSINFAPGVVGSTGTA